MIKAIKQTCTSFFSEVWRWIYAFILKIWRKWGEPAVEFDTIDEHNRARFVSATMLTFAIVAGITLPLRYLLILPLQEALPHAFVASLASGLIFIVQRRAQRGNYKLGIIASIVIATGAINLAIVTIGSEINTFYFLFIVMIFAAAVRPVRDVVYLALIHIGLMTFIGIMSPPDRSDEILRWTLPNFIVITIMLLIFTTYRNYLEEQSRKLLQESETRYKTVSELVSEYAYSMRVNEDGSLTSEWITDSYTRIMKRDLPIDKNPFTINEQIVHPDDVGILQSTLAETIAGKETNCEVRYLNWRGNRMWINIYRRPIMDDTGRVVRIYGIAQDITAHKQASQQAEIITKQKERMHLTREFVHAISHDFRTSLSNIETNRYLIKRKAQDQDVDNIDPNLDMMEHHIQRMTKRLDGLTIIADLGEVEIESTSLAPHLNQLILIYQSAAATRDIELVYEASADEPAIHVDISKIRLALRSLIDNAIAHTPEGGRITLATRHTDDTVFITVEDNGDGIDAKHLPHLFELFYRTDPARNVNQGGLGIGLSVVRFVVEAHQGTVSVKSELGVGTCFTIELPNNPLIHLSDKPIAMPVISIAERAADVM